MNSAADIKKKMMLEIYKAGEQGIPLPRRRAPVDSLVAKRLVNKVLLPHDTCGVDRLYLTPAGREAARMVKETERDQA